MKAKTTMMRVSNELITEINFLVKQGFTKVEATRKIAKLMKAKRQRCTNVYRR